jgi:hypothetical protein
MPLLVRFMAGVAAERHLNPDVSYEKSMDWKEAHRWAAMALCDFVIVEGCAEVSEEEVERNREAIQQVLEDARDEAERLVGENLDAVRRVAEFLLRRGRVSGDEVAEVVNAAHARPPEPPR